MQRLGDMRRVNVLDPDVAGVQHDPYPPLHSLRRQNTQHPRQAAPETVLPARIGLTRLVPCFI
jgi:hypothetical protein